MKVKLLRDARINHKAGEIVEVSPAEGDFLLSVGSAEKIAQVAEKATKPAVEVAEKAVKAVEATTDKSSLFAKQRNEVWSCLTR